MFVSLRRAQQLTSGQWARGVPRLLGATEYRGNAAAAWRRSTTTIAQQKLAAPMAASYDPAKVEEGWYEWWESNGFFTQRAKDGRLSGTKPFSMVLPPPNVTGALHLGHALTVTLEDAMARWQRMQGREVVWVPGLDHAGIATQVVVEKRLMREKNLSRHDVGREGFLGHVWEWYNSYGDRITKQLCRLGGSMDWSRRVFTMDDARSEAVMEAFIRLHEAGLVYRARRMVNWCCFLRTAISDIEVDYLSVDGPTMVKLPGRQSPVEFGVLHKIAYPIMAEDEEGAELIVATTRPETIFGDTAIAVHPEDKRFSRFIGMNVTNPMTGEPMPIVGDAELVDMEFGTGAVKVTPAHDPNDYQCGKRHNLPAVEVIDGYGRLTANAGPDFDGMDRFDSRSKIVQVLESSGLYRGREKHQTRITRCSRTGDVLEPLLLPQWFVDCSEMAAESLRLVKSNETKLIPDTYNATWNAWLGNIQDWCVSRQLWWGHRIPAFKATGPSIPVQEDGPWIVARSQAEARAMAQQKYGGDVTVVQDEDVLDTWFSSALFPLSVHGWPHKMPSPDHYPLDVMETGADILFFWVARMTMMCTFLTNGRVPFPDVYLHAMVRDATGRKMSKSLGNAIDPVEIIEGASLESMEQAIRTGNIDASEKEKALVALRKDFPEGIQECGADALRFTLAHYTVQGRNINLDVNRVATSRYLCNKLWNASKFIMSKDMHSYDYVPGRLSLADRWMLSRVASTVGAVDSALGSYDFSLACSSIRQLLVNDLCDKYIEFTKPVFGHDPSLSPVDAASAALVLRVTLDNVLRLMHPFMPYVTEELWQRLKECSKVPEDFSDLASSISTPSISITSYPHLGTHARWIDEKAERDIELVDEAVHKLRACLQQHKASGHKVKSAVGMIYCPSEETADILQSEMRLLGIARYSDIVVSSSEDVLEKGRATSGEGVVVQSIHGSFGEGVVVFELEDSSNNGKKKVSSGKVVKMRKELERLESKRAVPAYSERVPAHIQEKDLNKINDLKKRLQAVEDS